MVKGNLGAGLGTISDCQAQVGVAVAVAVAVAVGAGAALTVAGSDFAHDQSVYFGGAIDSGPVIAGVTGSGDAVLGADPRIGERSLRAGLGFGGGCLPKDIRAFMQRAGELGVAEALGFLREVEKINLRRRSRTVDLVLELVGGNLAGVSVCVLGAAFKPGSDDVRDSPALDVAQILHGFGAHVTVYDPVATANAAAIHPELRYAETLAAAAKDASVVLLLTEWPEFTNIVPADLKGIVKHKNITDGRNVIIPERRQDAGWPFRAWCWHRLHATS